MHTKLVEKARRSLILRPLYPIVLQAHLAGRSSCSVQMSCSSSYGSQESLGNGVQHSKLLRTNSCYYVYPPEKMIMVSAGLTGLSFQRVAFPAFAIPPFAGTGPLQEHPQDHFRSTHVQYQGEVPHPNAITSNGKIREGYARDFGWQRKVIHENMFAKDWIKDPDEIGKWTISAFGLEKR